MKENLQQELHLAIAAIQSGDPASARPPLLRLCKAMKSNYTVWFLTGVMHSLLGEIPEAITAYQRCIEIYPNHAEAHNNLGTMLERQGDRTTAHKHYQAAIQIKPDYAIAHYNVGNWHHTQYNLDVAIQHYLRAVQLSPGYTSALNNLGLAYSQAGKIELALETFSQTLRINSNDVDTLINAGHANYLARNPDCAAELYARARALSPDKPELWNNKGLLATWQQHYTEAESCYQHALHLRPDYREAANNLGQLLLGQQNYRRGWRFYLCRSGLNRSAQYQPEPLPNHLTAQPLLLLRDQGIGDQVFLLRFAPYLQQRGAILHCTADAKLAPLLARTNLFSSVNSNQEIPQVGYPILMGDLPYLSTQLSEDYTPPPPLSLRPETSYLAQARERLAALGPPPYVGLTWRAGVAGFNQLYKAVPLNIIAHIARKPTATYLVLQRNPRSEEVDQLATLLNAPLHDLSALNDNLEAMLAILECLDEYVCVSNTNTHLRESLGRHSLVLIPYPPEWRWTFTEKSSPWFPKCRILRERQDGTWPLALAEQ